MLTQPVRQLAASDAARSEIQDETFLILDACPTRLLPSTKGCPWISAKHSAAAVAASVGYKSTPLKVARCAYRPKMNARIGRT